MDNWDPQANEIFLKALALTSPEERATFLSHACADKTELRAQVISLLKAHHRAGTFLEAPATATMTDRPVTERPGTVIGPYKLLQQIGEGGFGIVYMAAQERPIRRKVALKIIKPGMDTRQVIARFEAERQALALMDHPNIAHVFDAGETTSGRPYFVMELVKGIPITTFCDQAKLGLRQRLELFQHVCQAVQHAHHKGIVHRDIKPSNILVTLHDGEPVVKIIDFGIAKAMGQELTEKTVFTGFAQMLGTPLYTSPEQVALSGLDIDTRTDVYSLGVLLYELLTGTTPFEKDRMQHAAYEEMRRIIREEDPPRPSTRVTTIGEQSAAIAAQRASQPRRLAQVFRGELDWIVMKALEKDRTRRYDTPLAFAGDIARYLANEAVQARPPSTAYRVSKFVRRHTWGTAAAAAAVFLLAIITGLIWREQQRQMQDLRARIALDQKAQREADINEARILTATEKFGEARDKYRKLIPELKRILGAEDPETLSALRDYATDLFHTGDFGELPDVRRQYTEVRTNKGTRLVQDLLAVADAYTLVGNRLEADKYAKAGQQRAIETNATARTYELLWWRLAMVRSGLGLENMWKNNILRAQVCALLNEKIWDTNPSRAVLESWNWDTLQFSLQRWAIAANAAPGSPAALSPVKAGNLGDLRAIGDLSEGIYLLSLDVTPAGGKPLHATSWMTLVPWDASLYPINHWAQSWTFPGAWYDLKAKPAEIRRRFMGLALTPVGSRDAGPGGRVEDFGIVATATVRPPPGQYRLVVSADDGVRVDVDGHHVMDAWTTGWENTAQTVTFDDTPHVLRVEYYQHEGPFTLWLQLQPQVTDPAITDLQPRVITYDHLNGQYTTDVNQWSDHAGALSQRGQFYARFGRFRAAADDLGETLRLSSTPHWNVWYAAWAQLQAGDDERFAKICNNMLDAFGNSRLPDERERAAKLAAALPGLVTRERLLAVDLSIRTEQTEDMRSWTHQTQGIVDYRVGKWKDAIEVLKASLTVDHGPYAAVITRYFLAMACYQADDRAQGRSYLDEANQIADSEVPSRADAGDLGDDWTDWILARRARREAEALFGSPPLPLSSSELRDRGETRARLGRFPEAAVDFRAAVAADPADFSALRLAAYAHLEAGNQADYERCCQLLLERFANDRLLNRREQIAKVFAPAPLSIDAARLETLLNYDPAKENSDNARSWTKLARGMVYYRGGEYQKSVEELSGSISYNIGPEGQAGAMFYQAMAYWRSHNEEQARSTLQKACQIADSKLPPAAGIGDLGNLWMDWLMVHRARQEAETLIGFHPATTRQDAPASAPAATLPNAVIPLTWTLLENGCKTVQTGTEFHVAGTTNQDGWNHFNGAQTGKDYPEGDFTVSADFKVPRFAGTGGNPSVYLRATADDGHGVAIYYGVQGIAGYQLQAWPDTKKMTGWTRPFLDEDKAYHRMTLQYDADTKIATGWIDRTRIGTMQAPMTGKLQFWLVANTDKAGMNIDLYFDNFTITPGKIVPPAPPNNPTP